MMNLAGRSRRATRSSRWIWVSCCRRCRSSGWRRRAGLAPGAQPVPDDIDREIARRMLARDGRGPLAPRGSEPDYAVPALDKALDVLELLADAAAA